MFSRRLARTHPTLEQRLASLRAAGFQVRREGEFRLEVEKEGCTAFLDLNREDPRIERSGIQLGGEVASLVDAGFMKIWATAGGVRQPALAADLLRLQAFRQDLREALGLRSLYNESLGTVCERHDYDRLSGR